MSVSQQLDSTPGFADVRSAPASAPRIADQIVRILQEHGIDKVFGIPGGTISPFFDALLDSEIEVISCQNETMAVYMASGYARATGTTGVVAVTSGPGVLNTVTGVAAATLDEAPVLVLAGDVITANADRGALQDGGPAGLDVNAMFRSICKHVETLAHPERATATISQALQITQERPHGAVVLRVPVDVCRLHRPSTRCVAAPDPGRAPDPGTAAEIGRALATARRPLIMAGVGARSAGASAALIELAEWFRCPVFTDIEAKGVFPESHPLSLGVFGVGHRGPITAYLGDPPDLLLTVGARLDDTTTLSYTSALKPSSLFVQLDHDRRRLGRSYAADIAMHADIVPALEEIARRAPTPDLASVLARDKALPTTRSRPEPVDAPLRNAPHDPRHVIRALQRAFGPDTVFTSDIGNHLVFASQNLVIDQPDGFFAGIGLGGMGSGIGNALGLALALGDARRVVAICGDGSVSMVGNELATAVEHQIPLTFAVLDDGRWGMVEDGMKSLYGRGRSWKLPSIDFVAWARALGAHAVRIREHADLERATARIPGPRVLVFPIDPGVKAENPRVSACSPTEEDRDHA